VEIVEPIRDLDKIDAVKNILKSQKNRDYIMFLVGINSGLRISDILKLKVSDVKDKDYITIKEQKTKKHKCFPITPAYKEALENYVINKNSEQYLFSGQKGPKPISRIQAYRIIRNACQTAGIQCKIGTHTLRKTFGYHFYKQNKDIVLLQHLFNHSSPNITLRYIGINQDIINTCLYSFSL